MAEQIVSYAGTAPRYAEDLVIQRPGVMRPISWGALFGGVMISLAFQLLMSILAIGLGLNFLGHHNGAPGGSVQMPSDSARDCGGVSSIWSLWCLAVISPRGCQEWWEWATASCMES
jgi:hypothetical protein